MSDKKYCSFVSKRGISCKKPVLGDSKYCYLKSHHKDKKSYEETLTAVKKKWKNDTYPCEFFCKKNVKNNGWCFYESFTISLYEIYKKTKKNKEINDFFKDFKNIDKSTLTTLSHKLFFMSFNWLKNNLTEIHVETKEDIKTFLINSKEIDNINKYFCVKDIYDITDDSELLYEYWGGVLEQYVLSKIFNINVITFIPTNFSLCKIDKKYKIKIVKSIRKEITRYKLSNYVSINKKHIFLDNLYSIKNNIDTLSINTVFLLLYILKNKGDNISHYNHLLLNI